MNIHTKPAWLSADVQAHIYPPPILLIKSVTEEVNKCDIIKINMRQNPESADSDTYKLNIAMFDNRKQEEFLGIMKKFKTAIDGT